LAESACAEATQRHESCERERGSPYRYERDVTRDHAACGVA
jgi:hypothetical protein